MTDRAEYTARAEECLRLASQVEAAEAKNALLDMAVAWLQLEDKARKVSRAGVALSSLSVAPTHPPTSQPPSSPAGDPQPPSP